VPRKVLKDMNTEYEYDEKELKEFEEWLETLGMTLECPWGTN
jgi:hypothetical protein